MITFETQQANEHGLIESVIVKDGDKLILTLAQHNTGPPFQVITHLHNNKNSVGNWLDFPNLHSAMAFILAELYNYKNI